MTDQVAYEVFCKAVLSTAITFIAALRLDSTGLEGCISNT